MDSEIHLHIEENSKLQDLIVYARTARYAINKDQSGWGFTVKQGTITIHDQFVN